MVSKNITAPTSLAGCNETGDIEVDILPTVDYVQKYDNLDDNRMYDGCYVLSKVETYIVNVICD